MADTSKIEWTDATWQIVTGCDIVSPGCTNCYAMKLAGTRLRSHPSRAGLTKMTKAGPVWTGEVRFNEQWLRQPLGWKRPRMIFVAAHGDLFHEGVSDAVLDKVFAIMALAPHHTFQVLTKRSARMRDYLSSEQTIGRIADAVQPLRTDSLPVGPLPHLHGGERWWPLPNVWLGVSTEDQQRADERIPDLLATPAAVRFVSAEPLLGPLDLSGFMWPVHGWWRSQHKSYAEAKAAGAECGLTRQALVGAWCTFLDWVIVGAESQRGARPMQEAWARDIVAQCQAAGAAPFVKQLTGVGGRAIKDMALFPEELRIREMPKIRKAA